VCVFHINRSWDSIIIVESGIPANPGYHPWKKNGFVISVSLYLK